MTGDGMTGSMSLDGMMFSTYDEDNDASSMNCASAKRGAWWYRACSYPNLNGVYEEGGSQNYNFAWYNWLGYQNLKSSVIMVRPQ